RAAPQVPERERRQARSELPLDDRECQTLPALFGGLAQTEDRLQAVRQGRPDLAVDLIIPFVEEMASFGMPEENEPTAKLCEHGRRHFAGERSTRLPVAVLRAEGDR